MLLIITASNGKNLELAQHLASLAAPTIERTQLLDLTELDLPLYTPQAQAKGIPPALGPLAKLFLEVVIAPDATPEALAILAAKKNVRVLLAGTLPDPATAGMTLKSVGGGYLFQTRDNGHLKKSDLKVVTKRAPTAQELDDLLFAFTVCKHVKSNAIVYAKDGATVGVGAGQMNRRDSSRIAAIRAAESGVAAGLKTSPAVGSVVASDAFFPFADGLVAAAEAGATAIIQPGGSMRDKEVIEAADDAGLAMVFTRMRHFRH